MKQFQEQMPARGFQSTVSSVLHFGLAAQSEIDSLKIVWPGGKTQLLTGVKADQLLTLEEKNASQSSMKPAKITAIFAEVASPVSYKAPQYGINDFKRQPLLVNPLSFSGPVLRKGDLNGDGLEDIYAGGGSGTPAMLYMQQKNGSFIASSQTSFAADKACEDADAAFFDANGDGYTDIYVATGGYHNYGSEDPLLQDRIYLNDGKGNFTKAENALPAMLVSKGCVKVADINSDGHPDLFVGGRAIPVNILKRRGVTCLLMMARDILRIEQKSLHLDLNMSAW